MAFRSLVNVALIVVCCQQAVWSQNDAALEQWFGTLDAGAAKLRLKFDIVRNEGTATGTLTSLDQNNAQLEISELTIGDGKFVAIINAVNGKFEGELNEAGNEVVGIWQQGPAELPLTLRRVDAITDVEPNSVWQGTLKSGGAELKLQFRLLPTEDGGEELLFDSLSQGTMGIKAKMELEGDSVHIDIPLIQAQFDGKLNEDESQASGAWHQLGIKTPLTFVKVEKASTLFDDLERPQHPKRPYAYREQLVSFENTVSGNTLAGTLTLPRAKGTYPCVVLISGSGPQDRDESLMGHKPFLVVADHLTKSGIAVLRFDDRGVGQSTGDFSTATSRDFARDVAAAVKFLQTQEEVDGKRIGLVGHSEGGLIAPYVATKMPEEIAQIILLSGPGVDGGEILLSQSEAIHRAMNSSDAEVAASKALLEKIIAAIKADLSPEELTELIEECVAEMENSEDAGDAENAEETNEMQDAMIRAQLQQMGSPWFRFFIQYDPAPTLEQVKCPVLALNGEKDLQVLPGLNLPVIEQALKKGGNADYRCVELPGLNHLFQSCQTGSPLEYQRLTETFSPQALTIMTEWILAR